jgi:hypothetical protein
MKFTAVLAALATTFTLALPTQAATFVGYDTLYNANDLTVIDDNGTLLDFLDLPLTQGTTVSGALGAYGNAGFRLPPMISFCCCSARSQSPMPPQHFWRGTITSLQRSHPSTLSIRLWV